METLKGKRQFNHYSHQIIMILTLSRYMLQLVTPLYTRLGSSPRPGEGHLDTKLRSTAISWACSMGSQECKHR